MGDMADMITDQFFDPQWDCGDSPDEFYTPRTSRRARSKICIACGRAGLYWKYIDNRWRLTIGGEIHICHVHKSMWGKGGTLPDKTKQRGIRWKHWRQILTTVRRKERL